MTLRKDRGSDAWNAHRESRRHRESRKRRHPKRPCGGNTPSTPTNLTFTWDTTEKGRHRRLSVVLGWDEVITNTAGASTKMRRYRVQLQRSLDGGSTTAGVTRRFLVGAKDEDADTTSGVEVRSVRKHVWYRFRVQAENERGGCRSAWSSWTAWTLANDHVAPPAPTNVKIYTASTNRVVIDWDGATVYLPIEGTVSGSGTTTLTGSGTFFNTQLERGDQIRIGAAGDVRTVTAIASDTSLTVDTAFSGSFSGEVCWSLEPDPDVAGYDVWLDDNVSFPAPAYKRDRDHHSTRISFRIPDADSGLTFYGRVKSYDASGNRSRWIPATIAGNSSSGATPDGVQVGAGGGKIVATWSKMGRSRVKHYANRRWTNTTGSRLYFKKARATCGDKEAATGAPTGSALKFNLRRWLSDESAHAPVFDAGGGVDDDDRLKIDAGTYKDVNGPSTFSITYLDPDEAITVKVTSVGSTYPGDDWTVQLMMEP